MRNLKLITAILICCATFLLGNTEPNLNTKTVIATSGLKLRATPGLDGEVIKVIPYGDQVDLVEKTEIRETIEWRLGNWVMITHEGQNGYLFDGFLSSLALPAKNELADSNLELSVPLISWIETNYDEILLPDTIQNEDLYLLENYFEGIKLTRRNNDYNYKVIVEMEGVQLEEIYNLLLSMVERTVDRGIFLENSLFVSNNTGQINAIKIQGYYPIVISKEENDRIKIEITSYELGC